ncbi:MAG TPA: TetR family transcriptional regulator [Roseomonas sp.]|nr:TetR family transcriptional regulator [Roseomonas sp.]
MNAGPDAPQARRRLAPEARTPQILQAALEEFAERGYAGARMAAVAGRAGIAKGLIYHYFPSKDALFQATVHACTQPLFEEAERQLSGHAGSARELLGALVRMGYARISADQQERTLFRLIITEAERFPDLARFYREEMLARATAIARAVLRAGVAAGEFRPEVADMPGLAEVVLAPVLMASVWRMILGESDAPAPGVLRDAHLDLLLRGLSA